MGKLKVIYIKSITSATILMAAVLMFCLSCKTETSGHTANHSAESSPQSLQRYIVLSPEIAEIIAVIEGTDNIIGITEECTFPATLSGKTVVGRFGTLNKEKIILLKPSIVFTTSLEQQAIGSELSKLGINVMTNYPKSLSEMLEGIVSVGKAIGKEERAAYVADSLKAELEQIRKNAVIETLPKVYLEIYREPLMSVSDQSFVGELIELAGGDNIFTELERDYSRIKAEDVIRAAPDIIICYSQDSVDNIKKRMGWQNIPAVQNNRIYFEKDLNPDWILRAGPRCILGARRLQEIFHGE